MKFSKRLEELVNESVKAAKGKKLKATFSRKMIDDITCAMLNDPDYEINTVNMKNGNHIIVPIKPVANFRRKFLTPILEKCGLDNSDREVFLRDFEFNTNQASSMYELSNAIMYEFMKTGKNYKLMPTEDFAGSIYMKPIAEDIVETSSGKVKRKAHYGLCKRSSCPKWMKERL